MPLISQGTISVEFNLNDDQPMNLFFIPERDYSIKYGERSYAVFVDVENETDATIRLLDDGRVRLGLDDVNGTTTIGQLKVRKLVAYVLALSAGMTNAKVEVEVEVEQTLKLAAIRPVK